MTHKPLFSAPLMDGTEFIKERRILHFQQFCFFWENQNENMQQILICNKSTCKFIHAIQVRTYLRACVHNIAGHYYASNK